MTISHHKKAPNKPANSNKTSGVYVVRYGDFFKVGYSNNIPRRVLEIDRKQPTEYCYLRTMRGVPPWAEAHLHGRFAQHHERGEWFRWFEGADEVLAREEGFIRTTKKPPTLQPPQRRRVRDEVWARLKEAAPIDETFLDLLRTRRHDEGILQRELAAAFGVSQPMWAQMEGGVVGIPEKWKPLVVRWVFHGRLPTRAELKALKKNKAA